MAVQDEVPKSRITLRYRTEIDGEPADISLPLRLLMLGDFSLGSSKDRKVDLEDRKIRNLDGTNTKAVMKDMKMSLSATVPNMIDPGESENLDIKIPITSLKSFTPDEVAKNVPKLRGLLTLRMLLVEIEGARNRVVLVEEHRRHECQALPGRLIGLAGSLRFGQRDLPLKRELAGPREALAEPGDLAKGDGAGTHRARCERILERRVG